MGFYYNWLEERWLPIDHDRKLTTAARHRIEQCSVLIERLLTEMEDGRDGTARLYAGLLVRHLVASDEALMRKYGKQTAVVTAPERASVLKASMREPQREMTLPNVVVSRHDKDD